MKRLTV